jgi:hypothetical protein
MLRWAAVLASDPAARSGDLQHARGLVERATLHVEFGAPLFDTLAALRFRTGDSEGALEAQLEAVAQRVRGLSLRELLRGDADALLARLGVYLAAVPSASRGGTPIEAVRAHRTEDGRALDVVLAEPAPNGRFMYLLAYEGDAETPSGIVGARFTTASSTARVGLPPVIAKVRRLEVAYTALTRVRPLRNESRYVPLHPSAVRFLTSAPQAPQDPPLQR